MQEGLLGIKKKIREMIVKMQFWRGFFSFFNLYYFFGIAFLTDIT